MKSAATHILLMGIFILMASTLYGFDPPKNLTWGMTYEEVTEILGQKPGKPPDISAREWNRKVKGKYPIVKDLKPNKLPKGYREYPELIASSDFKRAEMKNIGLIDKKAKRTDLVFDGSGGLCSFQYILKWDNEISRK